MIDMKYLLPVFFMLLTTVALAQEATIFTDRPTTTDAVKLIPQNTFQIEAGFMDQKEDAAGIKYHTGTIPNFSLKYGLASWLEMRVLGSYARVSAEAAGSKNTISGMAPIVLSPKIKIIDQHFWIPMVSLSTTFAFPGIGKDEFQHDRLNYGFRLLLEHVFNDRFSWSHGFGADWDDSTETTWAYSSAFSASLSGKVGAFAELYGYFATDYPSMHSFDAGLTYLVSTNFQVDTSFGLPLNANAPDFMISFGLAWNTHI